MNAFLRCFRHSRADVLVKRTYQCSERPGSDRFSPINDLYKL